MKLTLGGGENLNIEKNICLNALQLIVNRNDPALFDNADIFEKYLIVYISIIGSRDIFVNAW